MNKKENKEELHLCLACLGSKELYNEVEDIGIPCKYCEASGEATDAENECFMSELLKNN